MAKAPTETKPTAPTFETAMTRLDQLVGEMESRNIPLQDLIIRYEEGIQLVKVCEERLKEAEQRIEIITRNAAGKPALAEFEPDARPTPQPREDVSLF